ncbi:MAG TPA: pilus assembly protein PilM [Candidatus Babeliaceae bacterium]|nr:pilus assembly protein PilM [Candidatus Babeliaceae bacterium]
MIARLFIPEVIGSYYVLSQRIIGIELGRNQLYATIIKAHGNKRVLERCIEQQFDTDPTISYEQKTADAFKQILAQIGRFDKLYTCLSSSQVIFKDLTVPFTNPQKIKMILPLEIEPLLPFPLAQASTDSIITNKDSNKADLFAVAVQNETLAEHNLPFAQVGVTVSKVTVDLVELYGLFRQIPDYAQFKEGVVLLDLGLYTTKLAIIINQELKAVRVLPKGMVTLARAMAEGGDARDTLDRMLKQGINSNQEQIQAIAKEFFSEVQFTIQAFMSRTQPAPIVQTILISGLGAEITGMTNILQVIFSTSCKKLIDAQNIASIVTNTPGSNTIVPLDRFAISLATALGSPVTSQFNLSQANQNPIELRLIQQQIIVAGLLMIGTIGLLAGYSYMTVKRFKGETAVRERETVDRLKKAFPEVQRIARASAGTSLDTLNNEARREVAREKSIWFALSSKNRSSFLRELDELSSLIDRAGLGLDLKRLSIDGDILSLEGQVRDFDALRLLEEDLRRSHLFKVVPKLEETRFNLKLALDTHEEG